MPDDARQALIPASGRDYWGKKPYSTNIDQELLDKLSERFYNCEFAVVAAACRKVRFSACGASSLALFASDSEGRDPFPFVGNELAGDWKGSANMRQRDHSDEPPSAAHQQHSTFSL